MKKKNKLTTTCSDIEGKRSGYLASIKNINESDLTFKDYNKEMEKIISAENYLKKINNKYFNNNNSLHKYYKIRFKKESETCTLFFGELNEELGKVDFNSTYYLNAKSIKKNEITAQNKNKKKIELDLKECKLYNINQDYAEKEFKKTQKEIENIHKEDPKKINVILIINRNTKIKANKIEDNSIIKNFKKIMGENGFKKDLNESLTIIIKKIRDIDKIKSIIKNLKSHFTILKDLEFQTPKFKNGIGSPKSTNNYCDKFKNKFKDLILGKLESLIKFYDNFESLKKKTEKNIKSFDDNFIIDKFEEKRPK